VEAIYGCFRGLADTPPPAFSPHPSSLFLVPRSYFPFFLFVPHPLLNRKLFPSMPSVIHPPASKTLPACFVCQLEGNRPNKVTALSSSPRCRPGQPLSFDGLSKSSLVRGPRPRISTPSAPRPGVAHWVRQARATGRLGYFHLR